MINISRLPKYDEDAVKPMRDELYAVGFVETKTVEAVDINLSAKDDKTVLVVINSVCGCSAGSARPGVSLALQNSLIPDRLITVFAGQDLDAVDKVRSYLSNFPPSSPSIALFKNGEVLSFIPRHGIEGFNADQVAEKLINDFNKFCSNKGPSISPEKFFTLPQAQYCGTKIPGYKG
jgi:putative YphP/YqiW family bacilliredoxin